MSNEDTIAGEHEEFQRQFMQQSQQQAIQDDYSHLPYVYQLMARMYKPKYVQDMLVQIRNQMVMDRAYEKISFHQDKLFEAAAAQGASLGTLAFIDKMIELGQVIDSQ